jgi:Ni/Fe-hydrogenase subunit HybB-like protein
VMFYLTVLYIEFIPIVVERFKGRSPKVIDFLLRLFENTLGRVMFLFIIAGVLLSCLHQSSLGALLVIVPDKLHPLWHTPILPLLFLLSAISVGFPMVIVESLWASKAFGRKPEMDLLAPLSRAVALLLTVYLAVKVTDMAIRDTHVYLLEGGFEATMFIMEILFGVIIPIVLLSFRKVRRSPGLLFTAALLVVLGVMFNRINVFLVAYKPVYATERYFPHIGEIMVTVGLMSTLIFIYRVMVTVFPVIPGPVTDSGQALSSKGKK